MFSKSATNDESRPNSRPILSQSSILILSGFLVGNAWGNPIPSGLHIYAMLAGAAGIVAYLALNEVKRRNQRRAAEQANQEIRLLMARRIHRHIPRTIPERRRQPCCPPVNFAHQYVTVVRSNGISYR